MQESGEPPERDRLTKTKTVLEVCWLALRILLVLMAAVGSIHATGVM